MNVGTAQDASLTHVADSAKHIATPKKKDEKTRMSAVDAELYLGYMTLYTGIGSVKNMTDPMRCE